MAAMTRTPETSDSLLMSVRDPEDRVAWDRFDAIYLSVGALRRFSRTFDETINRVMSEPMVGHRVSILHFIDSTLSPLNFAERVATWRLELDILHQKCGRTVKTCQ